MIDRRDEFDSTDLLTDPEALRARAQEDGFLFLKAFLPAEPILDLRRFALSLIREQGMLSSKHDLMDGIADLEACRNFQNYAATCFTRDAYRAVQQSHLFHSFAHHPKLTALYEALFEEDVLVHPRHIMRLMMPGKNVHPTAPHQDVVYIHGTENTWTSWLPLGDCPMETGNLAMLKGSHKAGVLPVSRGKGAGGLQADLESVDCEWIHFNYQLGDVVTFPSKTVHKSIPTQHPERIRLSVDYRYQPVSEPVHVSSLNPHMSIMTWDEIYKDWPDRRFCHYWEDLPIKVTKTSSFETYPSLAKSLPLNVE